MLAKAIRPTLLFMLGVALLLPFLAHAQSGDFDAEIRAALFSADGADQLSAEEFDAMSEAMSQRVRESDLSVDDIALSRIEATLSASAAAQGGSITLDDTGGWGVPMIAILFVLLVGLVGFIWSKMHHGGAMGHGIGVTGMGQSSERKTPWVQH